MALIDTATPIEGIRFMLAELHMPQPEPTTVYEDNCYIIFLFDSDGPFEIGIVLVSLWTEYKVPVQIEGMLVGSKCRYCHLEFVR